MASVREELATRRHNLGNLLNSLGKNGEAEAAYRAALTIQEQLVADFARVPAYRQESGRAPTTTWAICSRRWGGAGRRRRPTGAALKIREQLAADFPPVPGTARNWPRATTTWALCWPTWGSAARRRRPTAHPGDPGETGRDFPQRAGVPPGAGQEPQQPGRSAARPGEPCGGGGGLPRRPGDPESSWPPTSPASPHRQDLAISHNNLGNLLQGLGKRRGGGGGSPRRPEDPGEAGRRLPPRAGLPPATGRRSHNNLGALLAAWGSARGGGGLPRRPDDPGRLAADFPSVPNYAVGLGGSYCDCRPSGPGKGPAKSAELVSPRRWAR